MSNPKIIDNNKWYRNDKGKLHRLDGPACEGENGEKVWYLNGERIYRLYPNGHTMKGDDMNDIPPSIKQSIKQSIIEHILKL